MNMDLTIIYYTSNWLDTANPEFLRSTRKQLNKVAGDYPIISVSQRPVAFGNRMICVGEIGRSHLNIYRQLLAGAKEAKTPFIATAEDDILYSHSHFRTHRPPPNRFAYDLNRWGINTWVQPPTFGYRARPVVNQLIAPTELLIEAMEERFAKFSDVPDDQVPISFWGDPGRYEKQLGVTVREIECFAAPEPSIVFSHEEAFGYLNHGKRKSVGEFPRTELPGWGTAEKIMELWKQTPSRVHFYDTPCGKYGRSDAEANDVESVDCPACLEWLSSNKAEGDIDLSNPIYGFAKCPKCHYSAVDLVDVLDAADKYLGESRHCRQCEWLEKDEIARHS